MMHPLVHWLTTPPNDQPGKGCATTHTYWLFFVGNVPGQFTKHFFFIEFWVGSGTIRVNKGLDLFRVSIFTWFLTLSFMSFGMSFKAAHTTRLFILESFIAFFYLTF